ncbi:MAG: gamma-glutamylcyclotransferase [Rhodospirillaceae bacterium]|jgi:glutathione-specific gamma-glutamylcyclotransferase|nr:gamma-glutamylcyclotransferase [Rhodospirillaceae bacterium]MBT5664772.1 gamma-glutamylcyclotransferase [Rhodospirillaceae bacterium]MBT5809903.1 gamma-glutamylcyclotransferase [Rhodospirillaceae bacterium]
MVFLISFPYKAVRSFRQSEPSGVSDVNTNPRSNPCAPSSNDATNEATRLQALRDRLHAIGDGEVWVFGYGSLLWDPGFEYEERRPALLHGYHRSFCVYSEYYRGTAERPGLVLGLDRGGSCRGAAYRLHRESASAILDYLWAREMIYNVYEPRIVQVRVADRQVQSRTFVANRWHKQYAGRLSMTEKSRLIRQGVGVGGANTAYLANTLSHLAALGVDDGALQRLRAMVECA